MTSYNEYERNSGFYSIRNKRHNPLNKSTKFDNILKYSCVAILGFALGASIYSANEIYNIKSNLVVLEEILKGLSEIKEYKF